MGEDEASTDFVELGLSPSAVEAYVCMLSEQGDDAESTAAGVDGSVIDDLVDAGLLIPAEGGGHQAVDPRVALNRLIDRHDAELRSRQSRVAHMRRVTTELASSVDRHRRVLSPSLEVVEGRGGIGDRISQLLLHAQEEVLVMLAWSPLIEALPATRVHDAALLERGVAVRMLALQAHVRASPEYAAHLRELTELGAEVRLATVLPTRLVTIDREVAIVPNDPASPQAAATVVHQRAVVALTVDAFESLWRESQTLSSRSQSQEWEPDALALKVLDLLAAGAKDESVSRSVGMSVRSVRRLISRISEEVAADSRFELGVVAASRGWARRDSAADPPSRH